MPTLTDISEQTKTGMLFIPDLCHLIKEGSIQTLCGIPEPEIIGVKHNGSITSNGICLMCYKKKCPICISKR